MAKIVTITNPLTGQPAQVDQLDHTAQQIDDGLNIARGVSNPNLLDNWYFGNPVNQRGKTSYTGNVYGPDRWLIILGTLTIDSDNGCLFVSSGCVFDQGFENLQIGVYTFSAFCVDGSVHSVTFNVAGSETDYYHLGCGLWVKASANGIRLYNSTSDSLGIKAVKLELGTTQTLAHQDSSGAWVLNEIPDYGEQLARCQRYFQRLPQQGAAYTMFGYGTCISGTKRVNIVMQFLKTMRTAPSVKSSGSFRLVDKNILNVYPVASVGYNQESLNSNTDSIGIYAESSSTLTAGEVYLLQAANDQNAHIDFVADL